MIAPQKIENSPTKSFRMRRIAHCHPDQPHYAKDLCKRCYDRQYWATYDEKDSVSRKLQVPSCHPERPYHAKGFCKQCYHADYGKAHYDEYKEWLKGHRSKHGEELLDIRRNKAREWRASDPRNQLLASARTRAKQLGLEYNLTKADIPVPEVCPILGIPLARGTGRNGPIPGSPSIDRVDPSKGYIPGNVKVISHRANTLKGNASADELRKIADYIDQHLRLN